MDAAAPRGTHGVVQTFEISGGGDLAALHDEWKHLAHECGALYFASPEWIGSWQKVFEPGCRLTVLVDGPTSDPDGILALAHLHRRLHHRVPVGIGHLAIAGSWVGAADHLGPVARSDASARRLLEAAVAYAGRRPLVLANLDQRFTGIAAGLGGAVEITTDECVVLHLAGVGSTEEIWNQKLRKNLRRRNRLMNEMGLERRWVHGGPEAVEAVHELRRLHLARWSSRGTGGLFDQQRMDFLVDLVGRADGEDGVWIEVIEGASGAVGVLLGFEYGGTFSAYKSGWDPSTQSLGMGLLLHGAAIERAISRGARRYDFLRGPHPHKFRLGGTSQTNHTLIVPNGPAGRTLVARDRLYAARLRAQYAEAHPEEFEPQE